MSQRTTFAAACDIQESPTQALSNPQGEPAPASAERPEGRQTCDILTPSEKASSCVNVRGAVPGTRQKVLVYTAHQRGHFDDLEASEAVAQRLDSFKYDDRAGRTDTGGISSSARIEKLASLGRFPTSVPVLVKEVVASAPTTRKMLKLSACKSVTRPLGSFSKRNSRSISARSAAAFRTSTATVSGVVANTNVLGGVVLSKKAARVLQQRRMTIANVLSPEKAISRSKLLTLRFPAIQRHNKELIFSQKYDSLCLFDAARRGPEGEVVAAHHLSWRTTGIYEDCDDNLVLPVSRDSDGGQKPDKISIAVAELDERTVQTDLKFNRIATHRSPSPESWRQVHSPIATVHKVTTPNIGISDIVELDNALPSQVSDSKWRQPRCHILDTKSGDMPLASDIEYHRNLGSAGLESQRHKGLSECRPIEVEYGVSPRPGPSQSPLSELSDVSSSSDADQQSDVSSQIVMTAGSQQLSRSSNRRNRSRSPELIVSPTRKSRSMPHIVEIPDSEDEDEFASDVDTFGLLQTTEADVAVRNSAHRDTTIQQSGRTPAISQLLSLVPLTSLPQSSISKSSTRCPMQSLNGQSRGVATSMKRSLATCSLKRGAREVGMKENISLAISAGCEKVQLESLSAAQLRDILQSWGFKAPRSRKDMIARILLYDSKMRTDTFDDKKSESQGRLITLPIMSTEEIKAATMNRISRHIREAESAREWWMKILAYEPILVEDLAQFLEQEGILAGPEKHGLVVLKEWCDSQSVCMISKDGAGGTRKRGQMKMYKDV
ncbi:uncharacterized protein V1513DRAFT_451903 [Lipomyces chichibuensis]|uniref:uncharacterized protein n=1 Tax=Lipomyces chichibuensis TaxID=1546026 RepID=UPI003343E8E1